VDERSRNSSVLEERDRYSDDDSATLSRVKGNAISRRTRVCFSSRFFSALTLRTSPCVAMREGYHTISALSRLTVVTVSTPTLNDLNNRDDPVENFKALSLL